MSEPKICITCEKRPAVAAPWYPCTGCGNDMCGFCRDQWSTGCIGVVPDPEDEGVAIDCPAQLCKLCREGVSSGEYRCPEHTRDLGAIFEGEEPEAQEAEFEQDRKRRKREQEDLRHFFGNFGERGRRMCSGIDCEEVEPGPDEERKAGRWQYCIECDTLWCIKCRALGITCLGCEEQSNTEHYACFYCLSKSDANRCLHCAGEKLPAAGL